MKTSFHQAHLLKVHHLPGALSPNLFNTWAFWGWAAFQIQIIATHPENSSTQHRVQHLGYFNEEKRGKELVALALEKWEKHTMATP